MLGQRGIMPEKLAAEEDLQKLERRVKKDESPTKSFEDKRLLQKALHMFCRVGDPPTENDAGEYSLLTGNIQQITNAVAFGLGG